MSLSQKCRKGQCIAPEDQAQRAGIWCERRAEHAVFSRLQRIHEREVQQLLASAATSAAVSGALNKLLKHSNGMEIVLAYPCDHFSRCYGLNRLLTLLLLQYANNMGLPIRAVPATGILSVTGVGHSVSPVTPRRVTVRSTR